MVVIDRKESNAIDSLRLLCVLSIVMIHANSLQGFPDNLESPLSIWHDCLCFIPHSLEVLFVLSGYLFFRNIGDSWDWQKHYKAKLQSRLVTLLLFCIVWGIIHILYYFRRGGHIISISDFFIGFWPSADSPYSWGRGMWFIRSLIVFSLLSPIYYIIVKKLNHFTTVFCLFIQAFSLHITFPYFNVYLLFGAYLGYKGISLTSIAQNINWYIALILLAILHILVQGAFLNLPLNPFVWVLLVLAAFIGLFHKYPISSKITASSTFIYAAHFFFVGRLNLELSHLLPICLTSGVLNMIFTWGTSIIICLVIYKIISRFPLICTILTGGRGIPKKT